MTVIWKHLQSNTYIHIKEAFYTLPEFMIEIIPGRISHYDKAAFSDAALLRKNQI